MIVATFPCYENVNQRGKDLRGALSPSALAGWSGVTGPYLLMVSLVGTIALGIVWAQRAP